MVTQVDTLCETVGTVGNQFHNLVPAPKFNKSYIINIVFPRSSFEHAVPIVYTICKGNLLRTKTLTAHLDSHLGEDLTYRLATRLKTHLTGQVYAGAQV